MLPVSHKYYFSQHFWSFTCDCVLKRLNLDTDLNTPIMESEFFLSVVCAIDRFPRPLVDLDQGVLCLKHAIKEDILLFLAVCLTLPNTVLVFRHAFYIIGLFQHQCMLNASTQSCMFTLLLFLQAEGQCLLWSICSGTWHRWPAASG